MGATSLSAMKVSVTEIRDMDKKKMKNNYFF